ncbi:hypothetical protein OSB04_023184 [Centaurea solstitialis]|uniref:MULE transposase domain-containing protein n=1 Tax=Centaurea solstitialis TaxID=347529 RepID=A0AA38T264_9ASTR|nr:hypothetical protein OSB04_023184 [Centaurea solstitialis]
MADEDESGLKDVLEAQYVHNEFLIEICDDYERDAFIEEEVDYDNEDVMVDVDEEENTNKFLIHNPHIPWNLMKPQVGERYASLVELKTCLTNYALANGLQLRCGRNYRLGSLVNSNWIAKQYGRKIRQNPSRKLVDLMESILKKYKCIVPVGQCSRAKAKALGEVETTLIDHYGKLWDYGEEINRSNPGELLSAVGRDATNQIYPLAWAVVEVESKSSWKWFLEYLMEDIGLTDGFGITIMSDQHKGLVEAVKDVFPLVEHRQCARHIYANFKKKFTGIQFRALFWAASKAGTPEEFQCVMQEIKGFLTKHLTI